MFVGRDKELALFDRMLAEGIPALIIVTGDPDMGKSSLLREFRRRAEEQGCTVFATRSEGPSKSLSIDRETTIEQFCQAISLVSPTDSLDSASSSETSSKPALILVDGYNPHKPFEDWFIKGFILRLKELNPARIVVVASAASDAERLKRHAARVMPLKPIASRAVVAYLHILNDSLQDKMQEKEIRAYAAALRQKPSLIEALDRLLKLESSGMA